MEKPESISCPNKETLNQSILTEWQNLLNETADILGVPAGLITRIDGAEIEILLSSETNGNPYPTSAKARYPDSGWFCEHTLKTKGLNLIPSALEDDRWKDNSAVSTFDMVSYIGLPIDRPDGMQFGTVCFLDNKKNAHNNLHIRIIEQIRRMIELSLRILHAKEEIDSRDRLLINLSRIYPICSYCKKIHEESGNWVNVEKYVRDISGAMASHSICPTCYETVKNDFDFEVHVPNGK